MSIVKDGYVKRHSKSLLHGGWKDVYLQLYSDSTLLAFKRQGDGHPKVRICMRDVCKHFAYGDHAVRNFREFPALPPYASPLCVLAIPERPNRNSKPHFFLMQNEQELHEWMTAICSTLGPRSWGQENYSQSSQPPPYSPGPHHGGASMSHPVGFYSSSQGRQQDQYPPQQYVYPQKQPGYPPQQGFPPQQGGYQQPQYYGQQPYVYQQPPQGGQYLGHHKKKSDFPGGKMGKIAAGLLGGAALGYGAKKMLGGFGKFGMGRSGSWSSIDSFGSGGSCGSFGSFD